MLALIAAAILGTAQAAPAADVACVLDRVTPSQRAGVVEEASTGRAGSVRAALDQAARSCGAERSWAPRHSQRMMMTAASMMLRDEVTRRFERDRQPVAAIDRWFARQPQNVRLTIDVSQETMVDLMETLPRDGWDMDQLLAHSEDIGLYVAARIVLEQMQAPAN